ncbi:MAG: hypothetical protein JWP52_2264 [Rhizobacter sp.]|nr:hypothetical protein [Rhizobacter sp.]
MSASAMAEPSCAPPPANPVPAQRPLPPRTCDTHLHVFGPQAHYPLVANRNYTPHVCSLDDYRRVMRAIGIERAVLVQPSVYRTDNSALLDALKEGGAAFRGVAVPAPDVSDAQLEDMHALGVRGIRLNLVNPSVLSVDDAVRLCARTASLGWHLQVLLRLDAQGMAQLFALIERVDVPLVIDHAGLVAPGADLQPLLDLIERHGCWVKLTAPYRTSREPHPHADLAPLAHALSQRIPNRLLWGTDWPHTEQTLSTTEPGALADLLRQWVPDDAALQGICVDNPSRLYGF